MNHHTTGAVALTLAAFGLPAAAQPDAATPADRNAAQTDPTPIPETSSDRVHLTLDLHFTNQYFFRGILQEHHGFIFQPSAELSFDLHESDSWSLSAYAGLWNSFHDKKTGATDPDEFLSTWYEIDFYAGLSLTTGRLTTDLGYTHYASPNDAFSHVDEVMLTFSWDDTGWLDGVTFSPYVALALETGTGQADGGDNQGLFLALGMEPSHTYESTPVGDLTISLPVEAGFSLDDYYEGADGDESFGYLTVGLAGSVALPSPRGFGAWSLNAGVDYLMLGETTEDINGGDDAEWIVHAGITFEF
jgi:hypothetical protein